MNKSGFHISLLVKNTDLSHGTESGIVAETPNTPKTHFEVHRLLSRARGTLPGVGGDLAEVSDAALQDGGGVARR